MRILPRTRDPLIPVNHYIAIPTPEQVIAAHPELTVAQARRLSSDLEQMAFIHQWQADRSARRASAKLRFKLSRPGRLAIALHLIKPLPRG